MPLISLLVCCRVAGNKNFSLFNLLDSLVEMSSDYNNFEVVLKFDNDDTEAPGVISRLGAYPFTIKHITEPRGRGYLDLHIFYNRMFACVDENSIVIGAMGDDFVLLQKDWDELIIGKARQYPDNIFVIHGIPHPPYYRDDYQEKKFFLDYDIDRAEDLEIIDEGPLWGRKLLDICGGFGHLSFTDVWTLMLQYFMYHRCGLDRTVFLDQPLIKRILNEDVDKFKSDRWWTDRVENFEFTRGQFYRTMVEEQALNIYGRIKLLEQSALPPEIVKREYPLHIRKLEPPTFSQNLKKTVESVIPPGMRPGVRGVYRKLRGRRDTD